MSGFFYNLGRMVGPKVRQARWVYDSLTGPSSTVTLRRQAWVVPVALTGAVHMGVAAVASEKVPVARPLVQAAVQA